MSSARCKISEPSLYSVYSVQDARMLSDDSRVCTTVRILLVKFEMSSKKKSLALHVTSKHLVSLETGSIVEYVSP